MPDRKGKRSSKSSRSHRRSHNDQSGETPRDPQVDSQLFQELYQLVMQRSQLQEHFTVRVRQLSVRRAGIQAAEQLYHILITMDFRLIHGLSSSANAARERRGVRHDSHKQYQTEDVDEQMHFYRELNQAAAMRREIEAIPQSLDQFAADEQEIIMDLANTQTTLAQINQRILDLQIWLQFLIGTDLTPAYFPFYGGNDDGHNDGGSGYTLDTGEAF